MKYFDYKWTWQLCNDSSFTQDEMKSEYGDLVHFSKPWMNCVSEIDTFFVVLKFGYIAITQDCFTNQTLSYIVEIFQRSTYI